MREDVGEVTTSLHPANKSSRSKPVPYDSFEWQPEEQPPSNGVPRSAWTRSHRRLSRSHLPYTFILVCLDLICALIASWIADTFLEKAHAGFAQKQLLFMNGE